MKYNLKLRHKEYNDHVEYWLVNKEKIDFTSITPSNHPAQSSGSFTKKEALRNFALLTSAKEGWEVEDSDDIWHNFVEKE